MKKKERFKATYSNKVYEIAGRWDGSIVLSPVGGLDDRCLIYTAGEIQELIRTGELLRETGNKKALFGRKIANLEDLKDLTESVLNKGEAGSSYEVTREVMLTGEEFQQFASDFLQDQPWISPEDGGSNKKGEIRCIRVINQETSERVLINSEGYGYPRYTALEK